MGKHLPLAHGHAMTLSQIVSVWFLYSLSKCIVSQLPFSQILVNHECHLWFRKFVFFLGAPASGRVRRLRRDPVRGGSLDLFLSLSSNEKIYCRHKSRSRPNFRSKGLSTDFSECWPRRVLWSIPTSAYPLSQLVSLKATKQCCRVVLFDSWYVAMEICLSRSWV